ncbi:MAG: metal ABC transporter permease [Ilumatobacteraceae bacterium]|jgi:manganese/iron transport system permease protein|nr:metal ABC transporter permease [Actinomycetota bacterium]MDA2974033.1 metal ABC transporter permease [Actinomycetota bacterium]
MTWLTDPIGWWIDPFVDNAFMREALLATVLAVACTSVIGTWVVLRGLAFLGDALAHGVLPGIAIAWVIGIDTSIGAIIAALAMVGGVAVIKQGSPLPDDVSIGVLFVGFLALAVVIMSAGAATGDLTRFLFGSINAVDGTDLARLGIVTAVVLTAVAIGHRALLVSTFDPLQARLGGLHPRATHLLLLALVALAIVASFETVGSLLVFAFLIAPPATASLLARRVVSIMALAVLLGCGASLVGLLVSYHHRAAAGGSMALANVVVFMVALIARRFVGATSEQPGLGHQAG